MKKNLPDIFTKSDKIICRLLSLFLGLILSISLSGQKLQTIQTDSWTDPNWVKFGLLTLTYDGNGFLTNVLVQTWDGLNWINSTQSIYINNPDGTADSVKNQSLVGGIWNNTTRIKYTYNASKKVLTSVTEMSSGPVWQNYKRQSNSYDGITGFLTNTLYQNWSVSWQNSTQTNYANNSDGNPTVEVDQSWNGSTWDNVSQSTYTYTGIKKVATDITEHWTAGNWAPYSQVTNTYDGIGLTNSLTQLWNTGSSSYDINDTQLNYTNNSDGTPSVVVDQKWDGVSTWNNLQRLTYTYSSPTRIPVLKSEERFTFYPNPAGDKITIKGNLSINGSSYYITDQTGRLVSKGKLINENGAIDISKLTNGIYFLRIGEKSQYSFKIVKNK